jgi:hypothetical protein
LFHKVAEQSDFKVLIAVEAIGFISSRPFRELEKRKMQAIGQQN